jgi:hypothetical protein
MVTFGISEAISINDFITKRKIINYLYNSLDLSKFRFNMLDNLEKLNNLKQTVHYVSPNFKGFQYFLLFTSINNQHMCLAIDKKKLSYHKNKVNIKQINIYKIKVTTSASIFNGTLFDCKLILSKNKSIMLIKDCYMIMGNNLLTMEMKKKMEYINNIINNQFSQNCCFNFVFKLNKLYEYEQLDILINNVIPKCKFQVHGLIFYPQYSGITTIYIEHKKESINYESNESEIVKNNSYDMISNINDFLSSRKYDYEKGPQKKLMIEKTDITDVYNLYENNTRIGIAHVPNLKTSHYLQNNINTKKEIYCVFNKKFNKYIPLKLL